MAKTTAPKSASKSPAESVPSPTRVSKARSKRSASKGVDGNGTSTVMPATFPMPTGAFTIEQPPDPGPKRERYTFAKIPHVLEIPNLIELQKASFEWFKTEGLARSVCLDLADQGLHRQPGPRVRRALARRAQVFGRGVPRARHDLQRAAARARPSHHGRVRRNQRHPRPRNFHGRFPAHDRQGHVHDQRRRARDREPARAFAGRVLQPGRRHEQPPDVQRDDHSEPRRVDRVRNRQRHEERRNRRHDRRSHRQEPQDLRLDVRARALASRISASTGRATKRSSRCSTIRRWFATRSTKTKTSRRAKTRSKKSTRSCVPASPKTRRTPRSCSSRCSSTRSATISRASAATSSTASSTTASKIRTSKRASTTPTMLIDEYADAGLEDAADREALPDARRHDRGDPPPDQSRDGRHSPKTTSTISATAASVRSANCCRISSASVCCVSSASCASA